MLTKGRFYATLFIISIVVFLSWAVVRINKACTFNEEVKGYLQNYVEAGTMEIAIKNLNSAIEALEKAGLTEGQISIFWENPNNNIGLWYNNLLKSRELLRKAVKESTLEQSIILEKQKIGLSGGNENDNGTISIAIPDGISMYPYNRFFFWWSILSAIMAIVFLIIVLVLCDSCEWDDPLIKTRNKK